MQAESFYRRPLPSPLVPFSSPQGRVLFREALAAGTMEGYFPLAEQFHTQAEPAFCGLGTLVIVLNALAIDPGRAWRGPWRWYSEELLDCCRPLEVVRREGVTLDDFACLARCNGASAQVHRSPPFASEAPGLHAGARPEHAFEARFRDALRQAACAPEGSHLVAAYDRAGLGQTGSGHYSPVAGWHEALDLVLLLDVARFKYPPHWVPVPVLLSAMQTADPATGRPRGYVLLARAGAAGRSLCSVSCSGRPFSEILGRLRTALTSALQQAAPRSPAEAVQVLVRHLPEEAAELVTLYTDTLGGELEPQHRALLQELMRGIRTLELYRVIVEAVEGPAREAPAVRRWRADGAAPAERAALLLLVLPPELLLPLPAALREPLEAQRAALALPEGLRGEVEWLRTQVQELERRCCEAGSPLTEAGTRS
jgi:glutathione gamma-glutamylcysteinyltransferase